MLFGGAEGLVMRRELILQMSDATAARHDGRNPYATMQLRDMDSVLSV